MLWKPFRPPRRLRAWSRSACLLLFALLAIDFLFLALRNPPTRRAALSSLQPGRRDRIFIASIHRNSEAILRTHWNDAVIALARYFGPENVFVSIYESGSQDNTKDALKDLDVELGMIGVAKKIILDMTVDEQVAEISNAPPEEEEGWILTSRNRIELRRIPHLAKTRNKAMEPLEAEAALGRKYDTVIWLNDVFFTTEDIVTLLVTRDGNYDAVCSLDFQIPTIYYDTFALRDISGQKATMMWPYFISSASRDALTANLPVPVKSCWNGVVVFKAEPFYASPPLRFRAVPDSLAKRHLEGSECCFIHVDGSRPNHQGVWLNPNVRVGYNLTTYVAVNPEIRDGRVWPPWTERVKGMWQNRTARWLGWLKRATEWHQVKSRVRAWEAKEVEKGKRPNHEPALHCLINEMQVLVENGWMHV